MLPPIPGDWTQLVRTWFGDEAAWERTVAAVLAVNESEFQANVQPVSDEAFGGATPEQLWTAVPAVYNRSTMFLADRVAQESDDHPVLFVRRSPPDSFRVIASEAWSVENNVPGNMDWDEFAGAVDADGVFRGF